MRKIIALFSIIALLIMTSCTLNNDKDVSLNLVEGVDKIPDEISMWSTVNEYYHDLDLNGYEEKITCYIDADKDTHGFLKNDGNNWAFVVEDTEKSKYFVLFNEYVQLGDVYFQVVDYFKEGKAIPKLILYKMTGADIVIKSFSYENSKFLWEKIYDTSMISNSGINVKFSTIPQV